MVVKFLNSHNVELIINRDIFSEESIIKCLYWWGDRLSVDLEKSDTSFIVTLSCTSEKLNLEDIIVSIKRDLLDFKTREIILNETKDIRALLIAKAFANDDAFDEKPPGAISDPLGFDPSKT